MLDHHHPNDEIMIELRRQLETVRRRIDETIGVLAEGRDAITSDDVDKIPTQAVSQGKGDLFLLCVRIEVALAESREAVRKLTNGLRQAAENEWAWPWDVDPRPERPSGSKDHWH